jgi:glutathione S-transferase
MLTISQGAQEARISRDQPERGSTGGCGRRFGTFGVQRDPAVRRRFEWLRKTLPRDLKQRADINRWLLWEASTWFPSCYTYLVEYVVKPLLKTEPDETIIEKEAPNWHRLAGILDARLAKSKWLSGDTVTIADIAVAAPMHPHKWQRLPLDEHPNLKRWMADVERLPRWQKTQGAVEQALQLK